MPGSLILPWNDIQFFVQGIYTILRDKTTSRKDLIFFVDRLATFLVEHAVAYLPFCKRTVDTPVGVQYNGSELDAKARYYFRTLLFVLIRLSAVYLWGIHIAIVRSGPSFPLCYLVHCSGGPLER